MAKKVITPAGIKFIYSINDVMLRQMYLSKLDLDSRSLKKISHLKRFELVELIRLIIIERWKVLKENHSYVVPTRPEIACYLFGVKSKSNTYMLDKEIRTNEYNIKLLVESYDYFTGLYQNYASDL